MPCPLLGISKDRKDREKMCYERGIFILLIYEIFLYIQFKEIVPDLVAYLSVLRSQMPRPKCALQLPTICRAGTKRFRDKLTSNGSYWHPIPKSTAFVQSNDSAFVCRLCYE